jgi:transcriptional regulator with XRE-family HTH domain
MQKAVNGRHGKRLLEVRQHRKLSQGRLARAIGVSIGTIQHFEHARVAITADRIEQMARALQCESADLLKPPGAPPPRYRHSYRGPRRRASRQLILDLDDVD